MFTIDILGTPYTIKFCGIKEEKQLEEADGFCDPTTKVICIKNDYEIEPDTVKDISALIRKVLRHEIIHAFLYESGLSSNCYWAENEEVVDWFAIQLPKLIQANSIIENIIENTK